jgi:hypothetical protein
MPNFVVPEPYRVKPILIPRKYRGGGLLSSTPSVTTPNIRRNIPKAKMLSWYRDAHDAFVNTTGMDETMAKCYVNNLVEGCEYISTVQDVLNNY